jgi:hypothetical protein
MWGLSRPIQVLYVLYYSRKMIGDIMSINPETKAVIDFHYHSRHKYMLFAVITAMIIFILIMILRETTDI